LKYLRPFGKFYGHLVILLSFGIIFPVLVFCTKKHLATLLVGTNFSYLVSKLPSEESQTPKLDNTTTRRMGDWPDKLGPSPVSPQTLPTRRREQTLADSPKSVFSLKGNKQTHFSHLKAPSFRNCRFVNSPTPISFVVSLAIFQGNTLLHEKVFFANTLKHYLSTFLMFQP
jgi:hypothetical protein